MNRRSSLFVASWSAAIATCVSACALFGPSDLNGLTLVSVETVNLRDRADIVWLSNDPRPSRPLLMVSFASAADLEAFARRYEYNIGMVASICQGVAIDQSKELQREPYIYDKVGVVDAFRKGEAPHESKTVADSRYHTYLYVKSIALAGQTGAFKYDLEEDPENVCLQLAGGNMLGRKFLSNTISIPKEALVAAKPRNAL